MKKLSLLLFPVLFILLFVSCNRSVIFDKKVIFPDANWTFDNRIITLEAPIKGSEKPYAVILELELIGIPNVSQFDATFKSIIPGGGQTIKPIIFNFANPQEPYIKGDSPNKKIYRLTLYPKKYFSETGTYSFEINQLSHNYDNYNIHALRVYVERVKE